MLVFVKSDFARLSPDTENDSDGGSFDDQVSNRRDLESFGPKKNRKRRRKKEPPAAALVLPLIAYVYWGWLRSC